MMTPSARPKRATQRGVRAKAEAAPTPTTSRARLAANRRPSPRTAQTGGVAPTASAAVRRVHGPRRGQHRERTGLDESATTREVRELIERVRANAGVEPVGSSTPGPSKPPPPPPPPDSGARRQRRESPKAAPPPSPAPAPRDGAAPLPRPPAPSTPAPAFDGLERVRGEEVDLDAKEASLERHRRALEKQMAAVKRQRAALHLQRRERELRETAATNVAAERARFDAEAEAAIAALRRGLEAEERRLEERRGALKAEMDRLCAAYEESANAAAALRDAFEVDAAAARAAAADRAKRREAEAAEAIRRRLESEALALGFRMSARGEGPGK